MRRSCRTSSRRRSSSSMRLEALDPDDPSTETALIEELGDLLYQIEFHATLAEQAGRFSIADVTAGDPRQARAPPPARLRRRRGRRRRTVIANWDDDQAREKGRTRVFDGVARSLPALAYAQHLSARRPRSGSTGPTSTGRWRRSTRSRPSCARRSPAVTRRASTTSSATSCSPPSTSPATSTSTPSWRRARRRPSSGAASRASRRSPRARHRPPRRRPGDARRPVGRGQGRRALTPAPAESGTPGEPSTGWCATRATWSRLCLRSPWGADPWAASRLRG